MKKYLLLLISAITYSSFSQFDCGSQFYDNGGTITDYLANTNQVVTICPSLPTDKVTITFLSFYTEAAHDGLYIFNGNSISSPIISSSNAAANVPGGLAGAYWGNINPGSFTSTSIDGCLTFRFRSDATNQCEGWVANVTCGPAVANTGFHLNAYLDLNNNGSQDSGEYNAPFGYFTYELNGGMGQINTNTGVFDLNENNATNNYNFSYYINSAHSSNFSVSPTTYSNVTIGTPASLVPLNFPITSVANFYDVGIYNIPLSNPRPGFNYTNRLSYTNYSNQPIASGSLTFTNDPVISIVSTSENVTSTPTGFTYNFSNLSPFETRTLDVVMSVPSIPTVALNQLLTNTVSIITSLTELTLTNNSNSLTQYIVGAYDPNDKIEAHGAKIVYSNFTVNDNLTYTIRFENTGTASAEKVRITDVLDSKIDETTVTMVASSHNYSLERIENNLTWKFINIQLPPSVNNSSIGKGFVTFKVKLKPGFQIGDIVPNMAKIYFDTNPAIDTNVFTTEFVTSLNNNNFDNESNFNIFPNPVKDIVTISSEKSIEISSIQIYNLLGQLVQTVLNPSNEIEVSNLKPGSYILKIISENGAETVKFLKE